jgi:low affinity Fe/Cu permease
LSEGEVWQMVSSLQVAISTLFCSALMHL